MNLLWVPFTGGVLAFAHCLGMCGGFVLHFAQHDDRRRALFCQLSWHVGRVFTYVFLGACVGFLGGVLSTPAPLLWTQRWLAYATGGVMIVAGLGLLGVVPSVGHGGVRSGISALLATLYHHLSQASSRRGAFVLGMATGFLPCPVVLGFLALATQHGSVTAGMATMGAFGAGTLWALLVLGVTGRMLNVWFRRWGATVAGIVLLLLGVATLLRGTGVWHRVLGCSAGAEPSCCTAPSREL